MEELFTVFIDRLKDGHVEKIQGAFAPSFLDVNELDLKFLVPVEVTGEVYLTNEELIIHLSGKTKASIPCSVCNQMVEVPLAFHGYYDTVPLKEIRGAVYQFKDQVREAFLIELPQYTECAEGNCPERVKLTPFMRRQSSTQPEGDTYFPFSEL